MKLKIVALVVALLSMCALIVAPPSSAAKVTWYVTRAKQCNYTPYPDRVTMAARWQRTKMADGRLGVRLQSVWLTYSNPNGSLTPLMSMDVTLRSLSRGLESHVDQLGKLRYGTIAKDFLKDPLTAKRVSTWSTRRIFVLITWDQYIFGRPRNVWSGLQGGSCAVYA